MARDTNYMAARRAIWSGIALAMLALLVTARLLTPSGSGVGTHLALGLPPCGFLLWSGLPCPGCGLTTAFAHLARGELLGSISANPLGLPLFVSVLVTLLLALVHARRGTAVGVVVERFQADRAALCLVLALLLSWSARLVSLSLP